MQPTKFVKGTVRRSLYFSILDGLFNAMMVGVSDFYLIPYGIALGANASQVAFLVGLPPAVSALIQLKSASITQSIGSRTKLINFIVFFHALSWLPIILIPYFFKDAAHLHWRPVVLLVCVMIFSSFGAFAVPAWQSLMSDYIPVKKRGKYFGWRNKMQGTLTILVSISAGLTLHKFGKKTFSGYTFIFVFAMLCRFYSWACLAQMKEPFRKSSHDIYFSFVSFLKQIHTSNFAKFVLFASLTSFTVNISASLFSVFLLQQLKYDYATYMAMVTTAAFSGVLFQQLWGKYGDARGNMRVLKIAGWGISILPALWAISQDFWFGILIQFTAGCFWGGFNLLLSNFMIEAVSPEKRIRCISYFNVMNNFSVMAGAAVGGFLLGRVPPVLGYSFLTVFLLSCFLRILVMAFIPQRIKEVRGVS